MFSGFTAGNYHPFTMLSFSIDYFLFGKNPEGFHFTNLVIHILNTLLVYVFILKINNNKNIALLVALFFGIQPMHAESILWISERKDLLYTFFLLLSLNAYLKLPPNTGRYSIKNYWVVTLFFLFSLLSKGQAVILPLLLLVIDYYRGELNIRSRWIEKIPFFFLSLLFGLIAIKAQHSTSAMRAGVQYDALHRILAAGYGIFTYIWKAILPINLSCLHPYPSLWDWSYYCSTIISIALILAMYLKRKENPSIFFGIMFFIICLLPVLQLVPVGNAILAERYTYLAYIGLFFAIFSFLTDKGILKFKGTIATIVIFGIVFIGLSWNRCDVWKDSKTLWSDVIEKYPECAIAYCNRGVAYSDANQSDLAEKDYELAVRFDTTYTQAFNDLGLINNNSGRYDQAMIYFNKAIKSDPNYGEAYNNRGVVFARKGQIQAALNDFRQSVKLSPTYANAWLNLGNAFIETKDTLRGLEYLNTAARYYLSQGNKEGFDHVNDRIKFFQ